MLVFLQEPFVFKFAMRKQHRNVAKSLDAILDIGERIVAKLTDEIGADKTTELLESLVQKNRGSQPRHTSDDTSRVIDLIEEDDCKDFEPRVPYGFWRRFCEEEQNLLFTKSKKTVT